MKNHTGLPSSFGEYMSNKDVWFAANFVTPQTPKGIYVGSPNLTADDIMNLKYFGVPYSVSTLQSKCMPVPVGPYSDTTQSVPEKEDKTMASASIDVNVSQASIEMTEVSAQRKWLSRQLDLHYYGVREELQYTFGLEERGPQSAQEAFEQILSGKATVDPDKSSDDSWGWWSCIKWDAPAKDRPGYDAAIKKLQDAKNTAEEDIRILPIEQALASYRTFKNQSFS